MSMTIPWTERKIASITPPQAGRDYYRDARTPGLRLCVLASGTKVFEFCKRMAGRPTRLSLGHYPAVTPAQARLEVIRLAGEVAHGRDPSDKRRQARKETKLAELFDLYVRDHLSGKRTCTEVTRMFHQHLAKWHGLKLSQIRPADVVALHAKLGRERGPYLANRVIEVIKATFNFGRRLGLQCDNPALAVKRFKEQSRDRFLTAPELRAFFDALAQEPDPWPDFYTLLLLTGGRKGNVLAMRWADIELERGLWRIGAEDSKNAEPMTVILHARAVQILLCRHKANAAANTPSPYVFASSGATCHLVETKGAWRRIRARAGLENVRPHDLRRTLGTWQLLTGASLPIIGRSLGHKSLAATAVYARMSLDSVRDSVTKAGDAILLAGNGITAEPPAETAGHKDDDHDEGKQGHDAGPEDSV